ncbi:MAG: rhodanese-like domain-containing protein [Actinomycetota bacterium]|nr:rhodanese-like domain-containing protein [Actinomycetota bacterium]
MKKAVILILVVALAVSFIIIAGCGEEESRTTSEVEDSQTTGETEETETPGEEVGANGYTDVSAAEAKKIIDENPDLVIIDVSPHYIEGHIPEAVNCCLGDGSLDRAIPDLDKDADYLVYCHVDSVSIAGAQALVDAGFQNVYRLQDNFQAWVDAGHPVET